MSYPLCSDCFNDQGLRLDARQIGIDDRDVCPNCGSTAGAKLDERLVRLLAHRFFEWGTLQRFDYGAAPLVASNSQHETDIKVSPSLRADVELFERTAGIGFFYYSPRLWMMGNVEPLKDLQDDKTRNGVIQRILDEYPDAILSPGEVFYRIRKSPKHPENVDEYDSAPLEFSGSNRLDMPSASVFYASKDLAVCVHECRVAADDELYVATMSPRHELRLLNLAFLLHDENVTEFESLDMAVHMLFLADSRSYPIARDIAQASLMAGYDGVLYPSYFSLLRTGNMPFETSFGLSTRVLPSLKNYEESKLVPNIALFGWPMADGRVEIQCINRLMLNRVDYGFHFGPVNC